MYETRDLKHMKNTLERYRELVQCPDLYNLSQLTLAESSCNDESIEILHIHDLPDTPNYTCFSYILDALSALEQTIGLLLVSTNHKLSVYILLRGHASTACTLLQTGLTQTFPDCICSYVENPSRFIDAVFDSKNYACLASSITIPNTTYQTPLLSDFKKLAGTSSDYVALFLAEPINRSLNCCYLNELYEIYDILSNFSQTNYTLYKSDAKTASNSSAHCSTHSANESLTHTEGESTSDSHNCYTNISASTPFTLISYKGRKSTSNHSHSDDSHKKEDGCDTASKEQSLSRDSPKNINASVLFNNAHGHSITHNSSKACAQGCGNSEAKTSTKSNSTSTTTYQAFNFSSPNKEIQDALACLTLAIERYNTLCHNSTFHFSSYFFSPLSETSLRTAYCYMGLCQSNYTLSSHIINYWQSESPNYEGLYKNLKQLVHPSFYLPNSDRVLYNAVPTLSTELINSMYFPTT